MSRRKQYLKIAATATLAMSIFACSENKTADEYLAEANTFKEQKDYNSAIISLKRANAENPTDAILRFELASLYLNQGDYANAEKEMEKAQSLGYSEELILPKLVEIKFKLNKYNDVYKLAEIGKALAPDDTLLPAKAINVLGSIYAEENNLNKPVEGSIYNLSLWYCFDLMKLKKGEEMTWVDVGGGTARVLEYFDAATIRKFFKKIFIPVWTKIKIIMSI